MGRRGGRSGGIESGGIWVESLGTGINLHWIYESRYIDDIQHVYAKDYYINIDL